MKHAVEQLIEKADAAIVEEDFDTLIDIYSDDAVLVIKPGLNATGKAQIRRAFEAIAAHFNHSLQVRQERMEILEAGECALVIANTVVSAENMPETTRNATYVFKKSQEGNWLCTIDNSYGHELLQKSV